MAIPTDNNWVPFYNVDFRGTYGRELDCYEVRLGDSKPVSLYRLAYSVANNLNQIGREFDLPVEVRKVKNYKPPAKKKPDASIYATVITKWFDGTPGRGGIQGQFGELNSMERENRCVYFNSKGPYIKVRSAGRQPVEPIGDGTYIVRYINGRVVDANGTRITR